MTLRLVDKPETPSGPTDDAIVYFTYDVRYHNKSTGLAETTRVQGYPMFVHGLYTFAKVDDKKNSYMELAVPLNEIIDIQIVNDGTEEA